ncbi:MAG: MarR family transcriptional regulator [Nitrospirae bacterium]|nr:MarR family transcriptional regulator [Nitrospirota bacterium]
MKYGYTQKEIADYLRVHYTTVSKIVKKVEGRS